MRLTSRWRIALSSLFLLGLVAWVLRSTYTPAPPPPPAGPIDDLFARHSVLRLHIDIPADALASLRLDPRQDVRVNLREGRQSYHGISLHLKGATSFRPVDDKPSFTLHFAQATPNRFHAQEKIHLNNSVEDPSFLHEMLGAAWFQDIGIPAARVTHALVELNGKKLGLYVVKEGFSPAFLARHFADATGNLYEPKSGGDIDSTLQQTSGPLSTNQSDRMALARAASEPDLALRWLMLGRLMDAERFMDFLALEVILGHRDGYGMARNNWRLYHDPTTDRMCFLPHGMDQLFGKPDLTWLPLMHGTVARAMLETPNGQRLYKDHFIALMNHHFDPIQISNRINQFLIPLRESLPASQSRDITRAAAELTRRVFARHQSLRQQLATPELALTVFVDNRASITNWHAVDVPPGGRVDLAEPAPHRKALHIVAGPATAASWRSTVLLPPGRYRFEANAMLSEVVPKEYARNKGAGLRTSAATNPPYHFIGTQPWTRLTTCFELHRAGQVELLCELFAQKGEVWFDLPSMVLVRLP